ncbi:MAG: NAD(P)-dependent alcohol dehydrogenase [Flavobacteriales bacterium]
MKAAYRDRYGRIDVLEIKEVDKPSPKNNEVLIKVFATTVNRTDCANLTAKPFIMRFVLGLFKPKKKIIGTDFVGEVIAKGNEATKFEIGDKVMGFFDTGIQSQAEFIAIKENIPFKIPHNIHYKRAIASIEGGHYAYTFIKKTNLQPGQSVFINGATGAIGSALIQFVNTFDVKITATCNTKNIELIKSLGANKIFDYTKEDFTKLETEKYDYIFDAVGKSTFGKCKHLLKKKGVYISSELGPYAQNIFYPLLTLLTNKKVVFPVPYSTKESLPYIINKLKNEQLKPVIDTEYAFESISKAYAYVMTGNKTGNVVININKV